MVGCGLQRRECDGSSVHGHILGISLRTSKGRGLGWGSNLNGMARRGAEKGKGRGERRREKGDGVGSPNGQRCAALLKGGFSHGHIPLVDIVSCV